MIHLICTLEARRIPFVSQFVAHYRSMGVERFHLSLHEEPGVSPELRECHREELELRLRRDGIAFAGFVVAPFSSQVLREHHDAIQDRHCPAGDWIVWADIDEFQVYPEEFRSLLAIADSYSIDYFRGNLIERISVGGELPAFDPEFPIWDQFPRMVMPPSPISPGVTEKVTCARSGVRVTRGNHYAADDVPLRYFSEEVKIHHFKWDATVVSRLSRRLQVDFKAQNAHWIESKAILDNIAGGNNRIEIR